MGQQQGKQGYPLPPPPMVEGVAPKPPPVSRIKGLKPRQQPKDGSWSPASQPLGAGPPSVAILGMFNDHSNGRTLKLFMNPLAILVNIKSNDNS